MRKLNNSTTNHQGNHQQLFHIPTERVRYQNEWNTRFCRKNLKFFLYVSIKIEQHKEVGQIQSLPKEKLRDHEINKYHTTEYTNKDNEILVEVVIENKDSYNTTTNALIRSLQSYWELTEERRSTIRASRKNRRWL